MGNGVCRRQRLEGWWLSVEVDVRNGRKGGIFGIEDEEMSDGDRDVRM